MTQVFKYSDIVFPFLAGHLEFLLEKRRGLKKKDLDYRIGINYSIILHAALLIEGVVEYNLKELLKHRMEILDSVIIPVFYRRRLYNTFIHNCEEHLKNTIEKTTGIEGFERLFLLFSYKRVPVKFSEFKYWEGIKVLFHFRNVLAHSREITAQKIFAWWNEYTEQDDFKGGYKLTEDYILKKKLTNQRFSKTLSHEHLFTNKVADHFSMITLKFLDFIEKIFEQEKKRFTIKNIKGI